MIVGGGSGGHVTPAVAVVHEILAQRPRTEIAFWTDFKYYKNVTKLTTELGVSRSIKVKRIPSGKFHRYAGWHFRDYFRFLDITIKDLIFGNFFGFLGFICGFITSIFCLARKKTRPNLIFLKGGYVGLPVGLAARLFRIPYIIHESDAVAGLANRILMKHAKKVAFGIKPSDEVMSKHKNYVWTGIPISRNFKVVTLSQEMSLKKAFSFNPEKPLVVITGGSQGSENLNNATRIILPELLKIASVALVAGRKHYENMVDLKQYENWDNASLESNFRMWEFNTTMDELMGAADIVVSRAGATTIAEIAASKKATILVPFERLPGGHQVKNAERLADLDAAIVVKDSVMLKKPTKLLEEIQRLVKSPRLRADMADRLHNEAYVDATSRLTSVILEEAERARKI